MKLPFLTELNTTRDMIDVFGGYNHNHRISDSEFYDMTNLTSDGYPSISVRNNRGIVDRLDVFNAMTSKGQLAYIDDHRLIYGGKEYDIPLSDYSNEEKYGKRRLVSFGAYIVLFPDRLQFNTNTEQWEYLYAKFESNGNPVSFRMCNADMAEYNYEALAVAPENPANGEYWLDVSSTPNALKVYSAATSTWTTIATAYIKISCLGIDKYFNEYDGITISGCKAVEDLNGSAIVWAKGTDYIVVVGVLNNATMQEDNMVFERSVPDMEFVTESENRLWGCHYGIVDGKPVNELYACKLGDAKNWNCYMGISTDSYSVSLGSDGVFTGAITHLGYPLFFKENCIHKVYGNMPSNYQVQTINCRGVQKGSHDSLSIVNEVLYYKSAVDVCAYDGSLPSSVSNALGSERYSDAVAGSISGKYYISMKDSSGKWHLFVYDTLRKMWHREDNTQVKAFCLHDTDLYFVDGKNNLCTTTGTGTSKEGSISWCAETGNIGYSHPDNKYLSKLTIRMNLAFGSTVDMYMQYDSCGEWEHKWHMNGVGTKSFSIPVVPHRCDHFRLKLVGQGDCKIFSISKVLEMGSDL